ncbi:hypothetical protein [Synechococcus sp. PCC 6312]|uniref:hypothetical protein n=1 Tax=Synechococcus sp. (strain ATCC 27167 / PCC 6312) TaxID=195253 RepID=UPI00029F3639|nr:hypothetical protein [Synechococcus sp. PCC 6312]AFY60306.1 hypothetical protein Syn6312_1116 [Synechococcus sp. PCC 6312]
MIIKISGIQIIILIGYFTLAFINDGIAQVPAQCLNFWTNPKTGQVECLNLRSQPIPVKPTTSPTQSVPATSPNRVTDRKLYELIKLGMSLKEVISILGTPITQESGVNYTWFRARQANVNDSISVLLVGQRIAGSDYFFVNPTNNRGSLESKYKAIQALRPPITLKMLESIMDKPADTSEPYSQLSWKTSKGAIQIDFQSGKVSQKSMYF